MQSLPDRLPLVIGVTGHRDLREEDVPRLEAEVARHAGVVKGRDAGMPEHTHREPRRRDPIGSPG